MEENEHKRIILAHKHKYFIYTMFVCASFSGASILLGIIYLNGKEDKQNLGILLLCLSAILLIVPFIVKYFDKIRQDDIISYDVENKMFYVYMCNDDEIDLQEIPVNKIADVQMHSYNEHHYHHHRRGMSRYFNHGGTITFILKDGLSIESLVVDDVKEAWKSIEKILIKNNQ